MANAKTKQAREELLAIITASGNINLMDLWVKANLTDEVLTGALQSLLHQGEIIISGKIGDEPKQISFGPAPIIADDDNGNVAAEHEIEDAIKVLSAGLLGLKKAAQSLSQDSVRSILADGVPRTSEELMARFKLPLLLLKGIPDVVVLPDGTYTLKDTEAGQQELVRRKEAVKIKKEIARRQRSQIDQMLAQQQVLTKNQIQQALGEKLVQDAVLHLVRLPKDRYTLPDSSAAWEEVGNYLARSKPITRQEFSRLFKRHRQLVASINKGREEPPFVLLPDGRVTVEDRLEGREELRRREILAYVHYTLNEKMGGRSFFTLEDFAPQQRGLAKQEALHAGCVELTVDSKVMYVAPIKAKQEQLAQELNQITGLNFAASKVSSQPLTYLLDVSWTTKETARKLGVRPKDVTNLFEQNYLQGFWLEQTLRLWRPSVDVLRISPHLTRYLRQTEKIKIADAARILGLTQQQIRRAMWEGYLRSAGKAKNSGGHLLRRGEVERLLTRLPEIKAAWEEKPGKISDKGPLRQKRRPRHRKPVPILNQGPIVLDQYQQKSVQALALGHNVLVAAPTGTGKTLIAEKLVESILKQNQAVIYTSPIKALSNQKYRDFVDLYGQERVGLITGDISINERAQLLVMTTEIFRNWCFTNPQWMDNISHIIFDEIHFLDDQERGTAWEESIIFAPPHIKILGLSATVPNIAELAAWMQDVREVPVVVVEEYRRAVPLQINWISFDYAILNEQQAREEIELLVEDFHPAGGKRRHIN